MKMFNFAYALVIGGVFAGQSAQAANAFDTMASDSRFSTWVEMLQQGGLAPRAATSAPYTVFVPVNDAWNNIPAAIKSELLPQSSASFPDTAKLSRVVRSHAVTGIHQPGEFAGKQVTLTSVIGSPIVVDGTASAMTIAFAGAKGRIVGPPVVADNAIIYPVDLIIANFP